jgi:hypothetical protein
MYATEVTSDKGKVVKRYENKNVKTPLMCLAELKEQGLVTFKAGVTLEGLLAQAASMTDLAAAQQMGQAKADLFALFNRSKQTVSRQA